MQLALRCLELRPETPAFVLWLLSVRPCGCCLMLSASALTAKVLLVSGTRDWVVPSTPEAILPMRDSVQQGGHRLVLVEGADHFSLRSFQGDATPAVIGPLLLAWVNEQLGVTSDGDFRVVPGVITSSPR